jgi:hypothetical protein
LDVWDPLLLRFFLPFLPEISTLTSKIRAAGRAPCLLRFFFPVDHDIFVATGYKIVMVASWLFTFT